MEYQTINSDKGPIEKTVFASDEVIADYRSFFDVIMESPSDTTCIEKSRITDSFFELKSGLAGDVLQKVSNYRKRLMIIGDFTKIESKSLTDFIYESNSTGKVVFSGSVESAIDLLK